MRQVPGEILDVAGNHVNHCAFPLDDAAYFQETALHDG